TKNNKVYKNKQINIKMDSATIMHLKGLIMGEEEDDENQLVRNANPGSVLNPSQIDGKSNENRSQAKPFAKIDIKKGNETQDLKQKVVQKVPQQQQQQQKENKSSDIWGEDEVKELPILKNDDRQMPDVEVLYKQRVGTEDVYLGMSNMDPSSTKCQDFLIKVHLPDTKFKDIQLDINSTAMVVQSPKYYLHHAFPYQVRDKDGKAQWISDKCILQITLPIIREELF
ncbi:hypothetical protein IMG5_148060, partial [Ichthyophthirius multifiliis]